MIVEHYPHPTTVGFSTFEKKPTTVVTVTPSTLKTHQFHDSYYEKLAAKRNITIAEYRRRDTIVRDQYRNCVYKPFDTVWPRDNAEAHRLGAIVIDRIAYDYAALGDDYVWPSSDNPLILTCHTKEADANGEVYNFFATVNFVCFAKPTNIK